MSTRRTRAMATAEEDRDSRLLAWCVAHLMRHAPDPVVTALTGRLDAPARAYLCRDQWLPAAAVTLLLRHGTATDRTLLARNPRVLGRPLPGLPGPARYAARRTPPALLPVLRAELGRDPGEGPLTTGELVTLLRRHGARRPRVPLDVLTLPHDLDEEALRSAHARQPLPPGAREALLLAAELTPATRAALLTTGRADGDGDADADGPAWYRPAVRAVRAGLATPGELVAHLAPAHRTLRLARLDGVRHGLRWTLPEQAETRTAVSRALRPLGDDPRLWAELLRHAGTFPGTLPDLVARLTGRALPGSTPAGPGLPEPPAGAPPAALAEILDGLAPFAARPPDGVERELALASLAVPMESAEEDIRWVRDCLDRSLLTGADVIRHKVPACWALDEDQWLGESGHPDRHDRPGAVLAARAEADRLLTAALGEDPRAWWRAARALPGFAGTLPELLAGAVHGDWVPDRP
ncbi:hypothetical protein [Streptomyces sp. NPDC051567]|uniref:hypothetical protein n=1 Tax=Streptomyces sp. NPDC051567 TaxID=3365660 RepID=UPI0037A420BB